MANPAYLKLVGKKQGLISKDAFTEDSVGNIYQEGHQDHIFVYSLSHNMSLPTDIQSGQPTQQRVHSPLSITKPIDKTTPILAGSLSAGEMMELCEIYWYRTSAHGTQEHFFTTRLTDAVIISITTNMPNTQSEETSHIPPTESIAFTYRKIEWEHLASGTMGSDDWRKPVT